MSDPPTEFFGKTWMFVALAFICGSLGALAAIMGPLFMFGIVKNARGQPDPDAGLALTIVCAPLLLMGGLGVFNIAARRQPLIRICREGLAVRMIGDSALDQIRWIPPTIRIAWLLLSFQGFTKRDVAIPWQTFHHAVVTGPVAGRSLALIGPAFGARDRNVTEPCLVSQQIVFGEHALRTPLPQIAAAIQHFFQDDDRTRLASWCM